MGDRFRILPFGERALLWEVGAVEVAHRAWSALEKHRPPGLRDVVVGAETLLLVFDDRVDSIGEAGAFLRHLDVGDERLSPRSHSISVVYDGEDLGDVARMAGTTPAEVVRLHTAPTYTVGFLGFSPGFAYLFGGDERLTVPRLGTPRTSVTAGSVALAGPMTAIYPQSTPGGWRLIGRTDAVMFDPSRGRPALLSPADRVRFEPVADRGGAPPGLTVVLEPPPPAAPWLRILGAGPLLTIQDEGRPGWAHAGVPVGGAADLNSARRANELVGNGRGAAVLEATMGRCRIRLGADRTVAVTGATADVTVDGLPARAHAPLPLRAGSELSIGPTRAGLRVYIAVAGGLDTPVVLGSRSTDTLSGLGPEPLAAGTLVGLGPPANRPVGGRAPTAATRLVAGDEVLELATTWGPRADRLSPSGRATLHAAEFTVGTSSDRTGTRLDGPPVGVAGEAQLPSEGMVAGAVQVPPGGLPIVLMRNHPPTGGYPAVAVVSERSVDELAQARPGTRVRLGFSPARTPGPRTD